MIKRYLLVFYAANFIIERLKIPFNAFNNEAAKLKAKELLDIWEDDNSTISQPKLFEIIEIELYDKLII